MNKRTRVCENGIPEASFVAPVWFLTGAASQEDLTSPAPRIVDLVVHAKSMGTTFSACGLNTTTWAKLWDIPFEMAASERQCPLCALRVGAARSSERAFPPRVIAERR